MSERFLAACAQMTSRADVDENLATCRRLVGEAHDRGARLIVLPENFAFMGLGEQEKFAIAEAVEAPGKIGQALREMASAHHMWVIAGGMPERSEAADKVYNTCLVVSPHGEIAARYRKIHLFDVDLPGAVLRESASVAAGSEIAVAKLEACTLGLSVCYDVRFPELYRALVERGANVLLVPAAFTVPTGRDHWEVLLRARAIESQAFVVAAAQWGEHNATRRSFGRSLIADPWGTVLCTVPDGEGVALAELDFARLEDVRRRLPSLRHRRL